MHVTRDTGLVKRLGPGVGQDFRRRRSIGLLLAGRYHWDCIARQQELATGLDVKDFGKIFANRPDTGLWLVFLIVSDVIGTNASVASAQNLNEITDRILFPTLLYSQWNGNAG